MSVTGGVATVQQRLSWSRQVRANAAYGITLFARRPRAPAKPRWRAYSRLAAAALIAMIATVCVMFFVDAWAVAAAKRAPHWLTEVFAELTDFGKSEWFLVPLGILFAAIAIFAARAPLRFTRLVLASVTVRVAFLFAAIALPSLFTTIIKRLIGRARPFVDGQVDPFHFMLGVWQPAYASFPSGHATTAFAAATAIGLVCPRLRPLMWMYALIIAASRVIVVAHFPSDVLAGALVGVLGALLVRDWFAARRLAFAIAPDGSVAALPGPSVARIKRVARTLLAP
jgi:membrane-associated phospholipid phosphatase